ncbi:MAG: alcohol dehydrogenase catalytic domain-containing protein, partial [Chloroflexota bacterium]
MAEMVQASTLIGPKRFEVREYPMPEIGADAGLLRMEACGVCGSDIKLQERLGGSPHIMGHENVGIIDRLGAAAARKWGMKEGDRVALEEYMPCGSCEFCRSEDYRFCPQTDVSLGGRRLFYGSTPVDEAPSLFGGFSQYLYLHPNAVLHKVPGHIPANLAAMYLPMSNGIEWAYRYGATQMGDTVVVQGPGQQGLCAVLAAREAGAAQIIVSGLTRDAHRLALARKLGAHHTIDVQQEDFRAKVMDLTGGRGANVVVNVTGGGTTTVADAIAVAATRRCTIVLAAPGSETISVGNWGRKRIALKTANGHSFDAVEQAIRFIASGKDDLLELCTHSYGLDEVGEAIRTVAGDGVPGGIHVSVLPWK